MFSSNTSQVAATATQAEAVDFDGTNDYLRRTSDLTGNTDGKTFTFSFWTWIPVGAPLGFVYYANNAGTGRFLVEVGAGQTVRIRGWTTSGTATLDVTTVSVVPAGTFVNVLISVDLANAANRRIYMNDVAVGATWTTYGNNNIDFTCLQHDICSNGSSADGTKRLSNVYLDYTYRDLSVEANRRLFVTADLKPAAGQAALNPILYLPMSDPTTVGTNTGTGGNFTLTGTIARSGRGPNQYNAPYSDLDGSADYLSRTTAPTGIADSNTFTLHCTLQPDALSAGAHNVISFSSSSDVKFRFYLQSGGTAVLNGYTSAGTNVLTINFSSGTFVVGRNYVIDVSVDLSDTAKRHVYVNGQSVAVTWATYTNNNIDFAITTTPRYNVSADSTNSAFYNGKLGALWFNTSYIDLSVASNRAKFVSGTGIDAKPVDLGATGELPTGTSPLIYLPMYGNNAGKNYGTGGDFTVNSGPYTGARGPNEFWGNKAVFNGTTGRLSRSTMSGVSASSTVSGSFWINVTNYPGSQAGILYGSSGLRILLSSTSTQPLTFVATNSAGTTILSVQTNTSTIATGINYFVRYCFDMTNAAKRFVYINDVSQSLIVSTYTNANIAHDLMAPIIGWNNGSGYLDGGLAEMYMTTSYIDFSLESERLKFRDAFGYPVNLSAQITAAAIPTPPIYVRFDPASQGTNSGTGGDFTKTGTITDGGQL